MLQRFTHTGLKKIPVLLLMVLMVFIQYSKLVHPHELIVSTAKDLNAVNDLKKDPHQTGISTDRSCSICDFNYLKDVHHYIASLHIEAPIFYRQVSSPCFCSIHDAAPSDISLRGPPAFV